VAALRSIAQSVGTASVSERTNLVLGDLQATVLRVTRLRHDDQGRPIVLEKVVLPLDRFPGLVPNGDHTSDIVKLAQRYGFSPGRATERVSNVPATSEIASHLEIAHGADVMRLDRVIRTNDGAPIEWRVAYCVQSTNSAPLKHKLGDAQTPGVADLDQ